MASDIHAHLQSALAEFDFPTATVSGNARRALRIAALRRDLVNQMWLQWELTDITSTTAKGWQEPAIAKIKANLDALLGAEGGKAAAIEAFRRFERNRAFTDENGKQMLNAQSIGQIEQDLALSRGVFGELTVPTNLTPIDTYFVAEKMDSAKAKMIPGLKRDVGILERVKSAIHSFLVTTEAELSEGQEESPLFLRAQAYINTALKQHAPDALDKFVAAQDRLYSGDPEDLAHALTSCRRMIKALADALYPATDEAITGDDGVERKMSDDAYRNRLVQYVREQLGRHGQSAVITKTVDSLGARLKSLDSLASKGVHDEVSAAEAEACIVWTYLLAADFVRIADGTSALLVRSEADGA